MALTRSVVRRGELAGLQGAAIANPHPSGFSVR
jgi:hypothetical protein